MNTNDINTVRLLLNKRPKISIIPHKNPDGDAMGSCLGLYLFLKEQGHDVTVVSPNDYPENLKWLPASEKVMIFDLNASEVTQQIANSELIFTLDFNALSRADGLTELLQHSKADFVMIDHHQQPENYAKVTFSQPDASSTCALVYEFIIALGSREQLNTDIATCLYTGLMTDTGNFKFQTTKPDTFRIAADLVELGAQNAKINTLIYDTNSFSRLQLLSVALKNMVYLNDIDVAYTYLTSNQLAEYQFQKGDTEGFVNYGLSIKDTKMAAFFIEEKGQDYVKISFRSKENTDVNALARAYFNGGGHINAAGGRFDGTITDAITHFLQVLPQFLKNQ